MIMQVLGTGSVLKRSTDRKRFNTVTAAVSIVIALVATLFMQSVIINPGVARADIGDAPVPGSGGGSGTGPSHYLMVGGDDARRVSNPYQGWGQASTDYWLKRMEAATGGQVSMKQLHKYMDAGCQAAMQKAIAKSGGKAKRARVVMIYMGLRKNNGKWVSWGANGNVFADNYDGVWNKSNMNSRFAGYSASLINQVKAHGKNSANAMRGSTGARGVCVAMNEYEPGYALGVSTTAAGYGTLAGDAKPVHDVIKTSGGPASEKLKANVVLNWDGYEGGAVKQVTKQVDVTGSGTTTSPDFTPADFGWKQWPAGRYWFDIKVARQGTMVQPTDTADRVASETWTLKTPPPVKTMHDNKGRVIDPTEVTAAAMQYTAHIKAHSAGAAQLRISDYLTEKDIWIGGKTADELSNVIVKNSTGETVDAKVTVDDAGSGRTVHAIIDNPAVDWYTLFVPVAPKATGKDFNIKNHGGTCWDKGFEKNCQTTDQKQIDKKTPDPNKAWVLNKDGQLVYDVNDPQKTNKVGADGKTFYHNDKVGAVVNGHFPANMVDDLDRYVLVDDWTKAAKYVDFTKAHETAKVYVRVGDEWVDKTEFFQFRTEGTRTIATATPEGLGDDGILVAGTKLLKNDVQTKLVIEGQFYPVNDETNTHGDTLVLYNEGLEIYNNEEIKTNVPPVFIWNPNPDKEVLGQKGQAGPHTDLSINENKVMPGQLLQYKVGIDMNLPNDNDRAYSLKRFSVVDKYDPNFIVNRKSIKIIDNRDRAKVVPVKYYNVKFDDAKHMFTVEFTEEWMKKFASNSQHLDRGADNKVQWLNMTFNGQVSTKVKGGDEIKNIAYQIVNDSTTPTNWVTNEVPPARPLKEDLDTQGNDINGKTVISGDRIVYRVTMDASPKPANTPGNAADKLAYWVHKLGMVDDYDEEFLDLEASNVKVLQAGTGKNVTSEFNVQVKNGKAYVFAKTHDYTKLDGTVIKGDPQPSDLAAYDNAPIKPDDDPIINQELLGHKYHIMLDTQVKKSQDGYVIKNVAYQNLENMKQVTNVVHNPLKEITPKKDATINASADAKSINNTEVGLNKQFNYKLSSSIIPAKRAYKSTDWSITDKYDTKHDRYTGTWLVIAERDIYDADGNVKYRKGDTLAKSKSPLAKLFKVNNAGEIVSMMDLRSPGGKFTLHAGEDVFKALAKMVPEAPKSTGEAMKKADDIKGMASAVLQTDLVNSEGVKMLAKGTELDKESLIKALNDAADKMTEQLFTVEETEHGVVTAKAEQGILDLFNTEKSMNAEQGWSVFIMMDRIAPGEVKNTHIETYNGKERKSNEVVTRTPENPGIKVTKWDKESGIKNGDRNKASDALTVTKDTVIVFTIKNTGDVPLVNVKLTDKTLSGDTDVKDIKCPATLEQNGLKPGETVECEGVLKGLQPGAKLHTDKATVTGESYYTGKKVTSEDPWNGAAPTVLAKTGAAMLPIGLVAFGLTAAGLVTIMSRRRSQVK